MLAKPLISVIIPSYNHARFVTEAVASVIDQTYESVEIIVVDDGSTDDTAERLAPYLDRIQYIHQRNQGVSVARNTGIKSAKGELIAFLDGDDRWLPTKLELQVRSFEKNRRVGLVHSNAFYFGMDLNTQWQTKESRKIFEGDCYTQLFLGNRIITSSVVVRRECLEKVGLFDELIRKASTEDYDMWMRIARYFEFAYMRDPLVLYRIHPDNAVNDMRTLVKNDCYVLEKSIARDPFLVENVGVGLVRERFFNNYFQLGYDSFNQGDRREAKRWFALALKRRFDSYTALLWVATWFPANLIDTARLLKRSLTVGDANRT